MTTYVLVHGAWHGGWCWRRVAARLRGAGHEAYAPTMTGLGERAHLANPDIALDTHIEDILAVIETEELESFVLVGHSYGGMIITGVADKVGDRIEALIYLDAFIPRNGDSMFSLRPAEQVAAMKRQASETGDGWRLAPPSPEHFCVQRAEDREWVARRMVPQPIATYGQPLPLTGDMPLAGRRAYILAEAYENSRFFAFADSVRGDPDWDCYGVAAGHDVMVDRPEELSGILMRYGAPASGR